MNKLIQEEIDKEQRRIYKKKDSNAITFIKQKGEAMKKKQEIILGILS